MYENIKTVKQYKHKTTHNNTARVEEETTIWTFWYVWWMVKSTYYVELHTNIWTENLWKHQERKFFFFFLKQKKTQKLPIMIQCMYKKHRFEFLDTYDEW